MKIDVLVLGGHVQALGIIRILGKNGLNAAVLDESRLNLSSFSIYCKEFIKCKNENLLNTLIDLKKNKRFQKCVIFPTNDFHVSILSQNKSLLEPVFICAVENWNVVKNFHFKNNAYNLVSKLKIPISKTFQINNLDELKKINIKYPCIIKPNVMHTFFKEEKKKVIKCLDQSELIKSFNSLLSKYKITDLLVQEIIEGNNNNQFSVGVFSIKGEIISSITACRARQHPIDFGNATSFAITTEEPILLNYARNIIQKVNYTGICEIEFKKDSNDGYFYFLEVNTRSWKWHSLCEAANIKLIENYTNYLRKNSINITVIPQKKAYFVHFTTDLPTKIKMRFKGLSILKPDKTYLKQHAVWCNKDWKPWFVEKLLIPYFIFSR
jgi:D-aspartate ligase